MAPRLLSVLALAVAFLAQPAAPQGIKSVSEIEECPRGFYSTGGYRQHQCIACARGRYNPTAGLVATSCALRCPAGKYGDTLGAKTEEDCKLCPPGVYGSQEGLVDPACTAPCPDGTYSEEWGLTASSQCTTCATSYRGWQCKHDIIPRKGYFDSTTAELLTDPS